MKPEFTPDGISIQTYQEIYDELAAAYKLIYGNDIDLSANTPDGQRVGIEAQARLDLQSYGAAIYQQMDPDFAIAQALNRIIKLSGLTRRPASRSQVDVTINVDRNLTLPDDYQVEDDLGQVWESDGTQSLTTGNNTVTLFAENFGAVEADAGTVNEPVTIVIGVQSVTNSAAATVGQDEETDEELRIRRNRSLENPATSTIGGLFAVLGDLSGVTDLAVYENDQDTTDVARDIPPHTIWCVVQGGDVADIVEAIAKNKTGGAGTKGDIEGIYEEDLERPDGSTFTIFHEMRFDRPTDVALTITLDVESKGGSAIDTAAIKAALVARTFRINENAIASDLYRNVYSAGDNFVATNLLISTSGEGPTDGRIESESDEIFTIDTADITITEL